MPVVIGTLEAVTPKLREWILQTPEQPHKYPQKSAVQETEEAEAFVPTDDNTATT